MCMLRFAVCPIFCYAVTAPKLLDILDTNSTPGGFWGKNCRICKFYLKRPKMYSLHQDLREFF